jgi:hypothetical protein
MLLNGLGLGYMMSCCFMSSTACTKYICRHMVKVCVYQAMPLAEAVQEDLKAWPHPSMANLNSSLYAGLLIALQA